MKHLFRQMPGKGFELGLSTSTWVLILTALAAATSAFVAAFTGKELSEFSRIILEDIAVSANLAMAAFFSLVLARQISADVNKGNVKACDAPFGMMSFLCGRIAASFAGMLPFFVVSSALFMAVHVSLFGKIPLRFLQLLLASTAAAVPLCGLAAACAIWSRKGKWIYAVLATLFAAAFAGSGRLPIVSRILIPEMDLYQIDTGLLHGTFGAWLYIFSIVGIGLVWALSAISLSSLAYNFSRGLNPYPSDRIGAKVLAFKLLIICLSFFFAVHISSGIKSIETDKSQTMGGRPVIPKSGLKGLWADLNYILMLDCAKQAEQSRNPAMLEIIETSYLECARLKPAFNMASKNSVLLFSTFNFCPPEAVNRLVADSFRNYLGNAYVPRDAEFEFAVASSLVSQSNPERDKYIAFASETLRKTAKIASPAEKSRILRKIVSLDADAFENSMWKQELMPVNRKFAELLVWYREWKRSVSMKNYEPLDDIPRLEERVLVAADDTEKDSNQNPNILSSVEKIRRNIYLARYISKQTIERF